MHPDLIRLEAERLLKEENPTAALQRFEDLIRLAPDHAAGWKGYGRALLMARRPAAAIEALERACGLDTSDWECRTALANVFQHISRLEETIHWHGEALRRSPDSLVLRLNHACIWPAVAESSEQIRDCRERCEEEMARLLLNPDIFLHPDHEATNHTFGLAYHGINDRAWLERYAQLVMHHVVGDETDALIPAPMNANWQALKTPRHRIGFLSTYFYAHSNTRAFEGLLRGLDRSRFEVVLIHLEGSKDDPVRQRLDASVDQVMHCPAHVAQAWQQLQALRLDLLFITDIGMNPQLQALICRRCAPVQVTGWGYPRTSGFPTLDYYLSGDLVEPGHAQEHYSETLVRLSGLPCCYLSEDLAVDPIAEAIGRAYFLLPEDPPLIGCLQTFWKMHPDFDAILERIAQEVPEAWFVFVEPTPPEHAQVFLSRLRRTAPAASERLVMLSGLKRSEYTVLAGCLDVLLDTLHFGSGISFYESIWTGTPMVTVEGPFLRSRYPAAGYRLMGLENPPVVKDPEEMAALTVSLLRDPARRESLRQRIREAASRHLYDRRDVVQSFEAFAEEAIARSRLTSPPWA